MIGPTFTLGLNNYLVFRLGDDTINNKCLYYNTSNNSNTNSIELTNCLTRMPSNSIPLTFDGINIFYIIGSTKYYLSTDLFSNRYFKF